MVILNVGTLNLGTPTTFLATTILLGIFTYGFYLVIWFIFRYRSLRKTFERHGVPGPDGRHWLYGHLHLLPSRSVDRLKLGQKFTDTYKRYYRFWVGPLRANIILIHPETVKLVLKSSEPKPKGFGGAYRHALPWLGEGLLLSDGERWSRARRLLTPAFHFDVLRPYVSIYNEAVNTLLEQVEKYSLSGESFDIFEPVSLCTFDIILRCAFSYQTDCQLSGQGHPYVKAVREITELWSERSRNPLMYPDIVYYLTPSGRKFVKQCNYVHRIAEDVIDKRKEFLDNNDVSERKCLDFLDILLTARDENGLGLTKLEIRNEVDTFMFEGHDTTASAISWILYSLAENPKHQEKCRNEIDKILEGRESDNIEWDDLPKLEYLSMCIKEGMRLHAPVPFIQRVATKSITIDGNTFPAGTPLSVNIYSLHHNPEVWEDHEVFKPERFTEDNFSKMDSFAYCPFSAGPRNCIGQNFARNEEKVVLAKILHRYKIETDPDHKTVKKVAAVMRAENGIRLFFRRRV